jgi:signal transduction histidine kinase
VARERNINAITEAPPGQLWIGFTRPGGLFCLRGGLFHEFRGAPPGGINALHADCSGRLWIATQEAGLGRIDQPGADPPSIRFYTRSHGLSSDEVWSLAEDSAGQIYAGTARGVDGLNPAAGRIIRYSEADGLAPGDIRAAASDRDGNLWFLSNRGLSRLRPAERPQRKAPVVRITGIRVAGVPLRISELGEANVGPHEFPSSRNSIQVDYSGIDYRSLEQVRYQFRLEGAGEQLSEPAPDAAVHLANLAPGHYRFLVRAISSEGLGSLAPASFAFTISPPVWQRWWFQAAIIVAVALAGFAAARFRLAQVIALERLRTRIATDLHDDIGASLTQISLLTEAARHEIGSQGAAAERLSRVAGISRELVKSMGDVVWAVNPAKDRLGDLTVRMRHFAADLLSTRNIEFRLRGPDAERHLSVAPEFRRQIYLFFKECVHNIARHADCASVEIDLRVEGDDLVLRLVDDGQGFEASPPGGGYGLQSLRRRAEELGGELRVLSRKGRGTIVTLCVPLAGRRRFRRQKST